MDNISRDTQYLQVKDSWSSLPLSKKAEMIKAAVKNGIYDLPTIRQKYNEFAEGGDTSYDDKLIDFVIQEEGFLKDPEDIGDGKQTLGSGLTAKKWHDLYRQRGNKWSEEDNRRAVAEELSNRRKWAEKNVPNWDILPEDSKNAMLSYKYNYDFNAENSPNMYAALRNRDWEEAARQMDATSKDPKFKKGLADRRAREQMLFLEGFVNSPLGPVLPKTYADQQKIIEPVSIRPLLQTPKRIDPRLAPIMVPDKDKYVSIHRITQEDADREEEQKVVDKIKAIDRFNKMMDMLSVENTATPAFVPYNPYVVNSNADGGSIYIKPSHRGRLTELKKRTGKTEAELYNDGNPAHKKMVVFARNSRRWKHGLGGNLFSGEEEGSQQMNTPTFWGTQKPFYEELIDFNRQRELGRQVQKEAIRKSLAQIQAIADKRAEDYLTTSNDAIYNNVVSKNSHLTDRSVEGAKAHRAWEEEHPNLTAWGNILSAAPFAVAAYPFATAAGSGVLAYFHL